MENDMLQTRSCCWGTAGKDEKNMDDSKQKGVMVCLKRGDTLKR